MRTKTFVAVGHESANNLGVKDHMQANLLANMEMGVHHHGDSCRTTGEEIQMQPTGRSDDPAYRATGDSDDAYYSRGPLQVCKSTTIQC